MMAQQTNAAVADRGSAGGHKSGRPLRVLNLLLLVLASINLVGLSFLALSRSRFEEIQVGITDGQQYLMDSWVADYLVRPTAIALFAGLFFLLVLKERLVANVANRLLMSAVGWVFSGTLFLLVVNSLYGF